MKRLLLLFPCLLLALPAWPDSPPAPDAFTGRGEIVASGKGPFHRIPLPLAVYQGASRADLGDVRVFNGKGELLPYAWWRDESRATPRAKEAGVPVFPLPGVAGKAGDDVEVTVRRSADGTLVAVRPGRAEGTPAASQGVVMDASGLLGAQSLRLTAVGGRQSFHPYTLESSDDLKQWRMLKSDAVFVHLEHEGRQLESAQADWPVPAGRYLRLLWRDPAQAPTVQAATLTRTESETAPPALLWSAPLASAATGEGYFDYDVPGQLPLEQLRINLPQINVLLPFTLQREVCGIYPSRHHRHQRRQECSWQGLAGGVAYRLQAGDGEARSGDIALNGGQGGRLRLRVDARGGSLGGAAPTLQIGFVPREAVFLARGEGPYTLAWGGTGLPADLPLSTLIPGQRAGQPPAADPATLKLPETAATQPAKTAVQGKAKAGPGEGKWLLWSVLAVGLLVLGFMARSLLAQMGGGQPK
ncbi:MAG TPA: DUF3999 domain-containing protein [Rhodocyclaceae bacterium]|nr:DUF3999 domain-containing protein [Rhodocyclaceae bacterium]